MIIKTLTENTPLNDSFNFEHGLSLYIEANDKKILFDTGFSDCFYQNALKLGVKIEDIDYLIISHGHNDHGGGLNEFLKLNKSAKIFIKEEAFLDYYSYKMDKFNYIGLDKNLKDNPRIINPSSFYQIDENLTLISNVMGKLFYPLSNQNLYKKQDESYIHDDFLHEQDLIIKENGKIILIMGCGHCGVVNIINHVISKLGKAPDVVIGGFHLSSRSKINENLKNVLDLAKYLTKFKSKFYTCHCTGEKAYRDMKTIMNDQLEYLHAGSIKTI